MSDDPRVHQCQQRLMDVVTHLTALGHISWSRAETDQGAVWTAQYQKRSLRYELDARSWPRLTVEGDDGLGYDACLRRLTDLDTVMGRCETEADDIAPKLASAHISFAKWHPIPLETWATLADTFERISAKDLIQEITPANVACGSLPASDEGLIVISRLRGQALATHAMQKLTALTTSGDLAWSEGQQRSLVAEHEDQRMDYLPATAGSRASLSVSTSAGLVHFAYPHDKLDQAIQQARKLSQGASCC